MRTGNHPTAHCLILFSAILFYYNFSLLKFAKTYQSFLTLQTTLIKNNDVTNFFLQFHSQLLMKLSLPLPYPVKFIQIILPIEYSVAQTYIRVFFQLRHQILSNRLTIEVKLLTTIADCPQITTRSTYLTIDFL